MAPSPSQCQQLAHVGVAGAIVATGTGSLAAAAVCGSAAGLGASTIGAFVKRLTTKDPSAGKSIEAIAERIVANARWRKHVGDGGGDLDAIEEGCAAVAQFGAKYWPANGVIAGVVSKEGDWPDAVAEHVVDLIATNESSAKFLSKDVGSGASRGAALTAAATALTAALEDEDFVKLLSPHIMMETLGVTGEIRGLVLGLSDDFTEYKAVSIALRTDISGRLTEIRSDLGVLADKVDEALDILRRLESQKGVEVEAAQERSLATIVADMLSEGEGARGRAKEKLTATPPDAAGALTELKQLAAQQEDSVTDAARTYREIGALAFYSNTDEALDAWQRVTELAPDDADAHNRLGLLYARTGDLPRAQTAYQRVMALGNQTADKEWLAIAAGNLGILEQTRGNLDAAEEWYKKGLAIEEELGRKEGIAQDYGNLGLLEQTLGNLDAAQDWYKKSLAIDEELDRKEGMAAAYGNLGLLEQTRGNLDAAEEWYRKGLAIDEELARKEGMAAKYGNLGNLEQTRGNLDSAEDWYKKSLEITEAEGMKEAVARVYGNLGILEEMRGNLDAAEDWYKKSLAIEEELGRKEGMAQDYGNLGNLERTRGNLDAAEDWYKKSLEITEAAGMKETSANQYGNLGTLEQRRGNLDAVRAHWEKALALFQEIGMPHRVEKVQGWLDGLDAGQKDGAGEDGG